MKRLKKEGWGGRTISDNQRLPTAKMVHAFCSSTANELQRYCKLVCSGTATALQRNCNSFAVTLQKVCRTLQ